MLQLTGENESIIRFCKEILHESNLPDNNITVKNCKLMKCLVFPKTAVYTFSRKMKNDFQNGTKLLKKAGSSRSNHHNQMNHENFDK